MVNAGGRGGGTVSSSWECFLASLLQEGVLYSHEGRFVLFLFRLELISENIAFLQVLLIFIVLLKVTHSLTLGLFEREVKVVMLSVCSNNHT